jgi:hypothetical protein
MNNPTCSEQQRLLFRPTGRIALAIGLLISVPAFAAEPEPSTFFVPGNLVVTVEGNGVAGAESGPYTDNQAAPLTLFQFQANSTNPTTAPAAFVNSLVLPQNASGANFPVSGEYGSSSEGTLQLSGLGQYLTLGGYGINAATYNSSPLTYTSYVDYSKATALGQSGSLTGQTYTPVPRVVALIDANGNVNSSTALYNVFNQNNIRSAFTANGSSVYVSGQGSNATENGTSKGASSLDNTGGVFYSAIGGINTSPTSITGNDAGSGESQETNDVQIFSNALYVSADSKEGSGNNRDFIGTLGTPPSTTLYVPSTADPYSTGPSMLKGFGNNGGTGRVQLTGAQSNGFTPTGSYTNLSPQNYFFASSSVLYVADGGSPKNDSASNEAPSPYSLCGAGGLQKWVLVGSTWTWRYTLYQGLNLTQNNNTGCSTNTSGTTGLYGLTGYVNDGVAYLFATNYTIADLDQTYLYGISDTLTTSTNPGTSFTLLATAPSDSNFKGVSFAPSIPAGSVEVTTSPSGLAFTSSGSGCAAGSYTSPVTLLWTSGSSCTLSVTSPQTSAGVQYAFTQWGDGTTTTTDMVTAPATSAIYTATFVPNVTSSVSVTSTGFSYNKIKKQGIATFTVTNSSAATISGPVQLVLSLPSGVTAVNETGTFQGNPYWTATAESLAPGASAQVSVTLGYASGPAFTVTDTVYSGSL